MLANTNAIAISACNSNQSGSKDNSINALVVSVSHNKLFEINKNHTANQDFCVLLFTKPCT